VLFAFVVAVVVAVVAFADLFVAVEDDAEDFIPPEIVDRFFDVLSRGSCSP